MSPGIYCAEALQNDVFKTLSQVAQKLDLECYVIGGYVRDYLLKRSGSKDIDIVAVGDGIALAQALAAALPGCSEVSVFKKLRDSHAPISRHDPRICRCPKGELRTAQQKSKSIAWKFIR